MSLMLCKFCDELADTDDDPDSLYVIGLPTEFD